MRFCLGNKGESQGTREGGTQKYMRAFVPLLLLMSGSGFHSDSGVFSELGQLPTTQVKAVAQAPVESSEEPVSVAADPALVRCRWQTDRQLLSRLGQENTAGTVRPAGGECQMEGGALASTSAGKKEIREKVVALASEDYPIVAMAESISRYDNHIAGLIVGIAKKESDWGKHTPKLHGEECFNYWGYRGPGNRGMTEDGYGCFEKPGDAVETIGNRLVELSELRSTTEPANMVVWKCGSSCAAHSPESVRKWISDVDIYYRQFAIK